jgi:hypothetical protein
MRRRHTSSSGISFLDIHYDIYHILIHLRSGWFSKTGSGAKLLFHGCEVPGLLHNHHSVLACEHCCVLPELLNYALHPNWRHGSLDGRVLIPQEGLSACRGRLTGLILVISETESQNLL